MIDHTVDTQIPWWAVWVPDYSDNNALTDCRNYYGQGIDPKRAPWKDDSPDQEVWRYIVAQAERLSNETTPAEFAGAHLEVARHAALKDPRAFAEFCGLTNDFLDPLQFKWFHVRVIRMIRRYRLSIALLPFAHGKSFITNYCIPLMDWAESAETTQIRIHQSGSFTNEVTNRLMQMVETHEGIHRMFPWIRRPEKGDPCEGIWSKRDGFAIGGKQVASASFRALPAGGGAVGWRGDRVIGDDWVKETNAHSYAEQEKFWNYLHTSAISMRTPLRDKTTYGTRWGTFSLVGTLYDNRDVNSRAYKTWKERMKLEKREKKPVQTYAMRFKVYPFRHSRERQEVLWPEWKPYDEIIKLEEDLGTRGFQLRCQNTPLSAGEVVFAEDKVKAALRHDLKFGELPPRGSQPYSVLIGFDPGSGGSSKYTKYPAVMVLAFPMGEETCFFVEWHRWRMPQPEQVRSLIQISRKYERAPIVVETNALQRSYAEWIKDQDPSIQCFPHFTGQVKHSWEDGVEQFKPLFDNDLAFICAGGAPKMELDALTSEFIDWPQADSSDLVMAAWFARYRYKQRQNMRNAADNFTQPYTPVYLSGRFHRQVVDLSEYR